MTYRYSLWVGLTAMVLGSLGLSSTTEARRQHPRCDTLARKVKRWGIQHRKFKQINKECNQTRQFWRKRCLKARKALIKFRHKFQQARNHYNMWGCSFDWKRWRHSRFFERNRNKFKRRNRSQQRRRRRQARKQGFRSPRCKALKGRLQRLRRFRNKRYKAYKKCKEYYYSVPKRCRTLRRHVNKWFRSHNLARNSYRMWGCRFSWKFMKSPFGDTPWN